MGGYYFVTSLTLLFVLRVVHGFTWGFTTTGAGTVASDIVPAARRGEGMGYYGLSNTLAMAAGPALGIIILNHAGFDSLFIAGFVVALIGLLALFGISFHQDIKIEVKGKLSLDSFFESKVYSLSILMFFTALVYGGIVSFITLYGNKIGVGNPGIYFLIYALTLLIIRPWAGKEFDKNGPIKIMALALLP
ncbi:hypothetical protein N752_21830 [Desulforamulus aquiferis]|nr:MFS transporter [Desulforamulus aquiferis]RYD03054.1 hypothetical protein N752_21830 [Desulforamulus aquiferis]